jgi:hypothetical protein
VVDRPSITARQRLVRAQWLHGPNMPVH